MKTALVLALLFGAPSSREEHQTFDCRYTGFCCQWDFFSKENGCRFRMNCKGKRVERVRVETDKDGRTTTVVLDRGTCK